MKKVIMVVLALSLVLSVIPVMAESQTPGALQAMSNLSTVVPMTDQQLAAVAGEGFVWQSNYARISQKISFSNCGYFAALNCNQSVSLIQSNVNID